MSDLRFAARAVIESWTRNGYADADTIHDLRQALESSPPSPPREFTEEQERRIREIADDLDGSLLDTHLTDGHHPIWDKFKVIEARLTALESRIAEKPKAEVPCPECGIIDGPNQGHAHSRKLDPPPAAPLSDAGKEKPSLPLGPGSECPYCGRTVLEGDAGVHSPLKCFAYNEPSNLRERRIRRASRIETLEELLNVAVQHGYDDASVKSPLYARIRSLLSSARSEAG